MYLTPGRFLLRCAILVSFVIALTFKVDPGHRWSGSKDFARRGSSHNVLDERSSWGVSAYADLPGVCPGASCLVLPALPPVPPPHNPGHPKEGEMFRGISGWGSVYMEQVTKPESVSWWELEGVRGSP